MTINNVSVRYNDGFLPDIVLFDSIRLLLIPSSRNPFQMLCKRFCTICSL